MKDPSLRRSLRDLSSSQSLPLRELAASGSFPLPEGAGAPWLDWPEFDRRAGGCRAMR
jgi:hypothetical protein